MKDCISLPTDRDRDMGLVLIFLSAVAYFILPYIALEFGVREGTARWVTVGLGTFFLATAVFIFTFSKKRIWLELEKQELRVKDGVFGRTIPLHWKEDPVFKLSSFEDESHGQPQEIWTVHLVSEGRQYLIDRRSEQQMVSRSLAERLTKVTGGKILEYQGGKSYHFSAEELELSYVERVARYPDLLGDEICEPPDKVVEHELTDRGVRVSWCFFRSGLLFEVFCVSAFLIIAAFIPIPGGPNGEGFSLFQAEVAQRDFRYFIGVGLFTGLSLFLLAGYRNTIELIMPKRIQSRSTIWGIPIRSGRISLEHLEHINVMLKSRGPYLQFISNDKLIRERMPATNIARWLAWEFRRALAGVEPAKCKIEQSVEMNSL